MWHLMGAGAENFVFEYHGRGTVVDGDGNEYRYHSRATDAVDGQGILRMVDRSGLLVPLQ